MITWRKASRCDIGNCVEVGFGWRNRVHIRDSERPEAGYLTVSEAAFGAFTDDIKADRYAS